MKAPDYLGNCNLLKMHIVGFFSSRTTAPLSVLPTLDWAHEVAQRSDIAVMSGFQSPMEREVLDILLRGQCSIIMVLNRSIYRKVPSYLNDAYLADRLLLISLCHSTSIRPSAKQAVTRNLYIAKTAKQLVFSSISSNSSLFTISLSPKTFIKL